MAKEVLNVTSLQEEVINKRIEGINRVAEHARQIDCPYVLLFKEVGVKNDFRAAIFVQPFKENTYLAITTTKGMTLLRDESDINNFGVVTERAILTESPAINSGIEGEVTNSCIIARDRYPNPGHIRMRIISNDVADQDIFNVVERSKKWATEQVVKRGELKNKLKREIENIDRIVDNMISPSPNTTPEA